MTKVEREVVFNSENGQKEMTGVRHSDDDVKKKVIDCVFKLRQLNNIPEKYVEKNSDCSRSSVGRVYRCNFDGRSPIPNWTTIFNFFSCVIGKATIIVNIPEVLCWILKLFLGDSADVGYTVDDSHHIRIDIQFHDDKTLFLAIAQTSRKVMGVVFSEEDNQPVIGASVLVKGTSIGTTTDLDGKFVINNVPSSSRTW